MDEIKRAYTALVSLSAFFETARDRSGRRPRRSSRRAWFLREGGRNIGEIVENEREWSRYEFILSGDMPDAP